MCRSQSESMKPRTINLKYRINNLNIHQTVKEYGKYVRKYLQLENNEQQKIPKPLKSVGEKMGEIIENTDIYRLGASEVNTDACYKKKFNAVMKTYLDISILILAILVISVISIRHY